MNCTLWIPAEDLRSARIVAFAVDAGRLPMLPHYATEQAADARAALLSEVHARKIPVFAVVLEKRTVDDGVITNVWPLVDRVGSAAVALLIVCGGCWAVAWGTLL